MQRERRHARMRERVRIGVLLLLTMVAMLVGPGTGVAAAAQDAPTSQTRVTVLHGDWSQGPVDVYLNNDLVLPNFAYGEQSDWIDFAPGSVRVTVTTDRGGLNTYNYVTFDAVYPAPAGNDYSLIITTPLLLGGVFDTSPVAEGGARVRIVQGAVSLRPVNVTANAASTTFAQDLRYSSASDYTVVPAGTYDIAVTLTHNGETVLRVPELVLEANMTYELVLMGQPGDAGHPLELRALSDPTRDDTAPAP
jgi:hypothetical protein